MSPKGVPRRPSGEGSLRRKGKVWYGVVTVPGGARRELSLKTTKKSTAVEKLRKLLDDASQGRIVPDKAIVRGRDGWKRLVANYRATGRKEVPERRWKHLEPAFGGDDVRAITTARMEAYANERRAEGAKPATINRELACLRRMLNLLRDDGVNFPRFPRFPRLTEDNVRTNFLDDDGYDRLHAELPAPHDVALSVGFWLGWRHGEVYGLEWRRVDLEAGTVRLDPGKTKNRRGRYVHLPEPLLVELRAWREATDVEEKRLGRIIPWVFHRHGRQLKSGRKAWRAAAIRAGVPGVWFHDLRRSAARAYVRAGVPGVIVQQITGHKTQSMLHRYVIVDDADMAMAAKRRATVGRVWARPRKRGGKGDVSG